MCRRHHHRFPSPPRTSADTCWKPVLEPQGPSESEAAGGSGPPGDALPASQVVPLSARPPFLAQRAGGAGKVGEQMPPGDRPQRPHPGKGFKVRVLGPLPGTSPSLPKPASQPLPCCSRQSCPRTLAPAAGSKKAPQPTEPVQTSGCPPRPGWTLGDPLASALRPGCWGLAGCSTRLRGRGQIACHVGG